MRTPTRAQSFDQPSSYTPRSHPVRYGYPPHKEAWSETNSVRSPTPNQSFDGPPRLKTSQSTTTLQRVKGAFENRYGQSPSLPPGSPPLQSSYTPFDLGLRRPLARKFDPQRQLLRLLIKGFTRWILTILIIVATVVTVWAYSHRKVLDGRDKRVFSALTTGLLLVLNINVQSSFKQAAIFMRWKIISNRRQTLRELDLTLGVDSMARVLKLAWVARAKPLMVLLCMAWLMLNIVRSPPIFVVFFSNLDQSMFVLVAVVQLTYSMEDSLGTLVTNGPVRIVKMDHYYPKNNSADIPSLGAEQSAAHTYGYISSSYVQGNASDFERLRGEGISQLAEFISFNMVDHWAYLYFDSNPTTHATFYTSRTVNATWLCAGYDVVQGGDGSTVDITYLDGGVRQPFTVGETGPGATTYMTETEEVCGPRCSRVWTFQTEIAQSGVKPTLYDCNVTVSQVSNAYLPEHGIPDLQARIAAGSIGLEGFQHQNTTKQWVRYRDNDWWAASQTNSAQDVGWLIGQYAIGTIGVAQEQNPTAIVEGQLAVRGTSLVVRWKYFLLILFALGAVQLIIFVFAVLFSNSVVVKDDSRLAIARLLRPIVDRLGSAGCVLDGEDISKTLRAEVVYGVRESGGWHHLDVGPDILPLKVFDSFPAGWYDGESERDEGQGGEWTTSASVSALKPVGSETASMDGWDDGYGYQRRRERATKWKTE